METYRTALVSGSAHWVKALEGALTAAGFAVSATRHPDRLPEPDTLPAPGSVHCYVQAPIDVVMGATTAVGRLREAFNGALLARFEAVETIRPALRPDATVVLVAADRHDGEGTPDDPHARFDLLRVLAEAIRVDNPAMRVVVAGPRCSSDEIVALAAGPGRVETPTPVSYADHGPDLDYADWREELLSLATHDDWERSLRPVPTPVRYPGWINPDGVPPDPDQVRSRTELDLDGGRPVHRPRGRR